MTVTCPGRLARRRRSVSSPAFVSPREPRTLPRPTPPPLIHSCPGARGREGRGLALSAPRVVSWAVPRGFAPSSFKRGQPVPRAVVLAPGQLRGVSPRPHCLTPGPRAPVTCSGQVRPCDRRGDQIPRSQPAGPAGFSPPGPVWQVALVGRQGGHRDPQLLPFQDPAVSQPLPSASLLLTKERPPLLPLLRPPANGRGRVPVRVGFLCSNLRTSVFASHLFDVC